MPKNNAAVYDISLLKAAGIKPEAIAAIAKLGSLNEIGTPLKDGIFKILATVDQQDACNRFNWINNPADLSDQELERMLYFKGNLALFYIAEIDRFMILPYALDGTIDVYGRYNSIRPVPFSSGEKVGNSQETIAEILTKKSYNVVKDIVMPEELLANPKIMTESAVIIRDYTPALSQTIVPRCELQKSLLDVMSDNIPFMRTALMNSTGVRGVRTTADAAQGVELTAETVYKAALNGKPYIPFQSTLEVQDLTSGIAIKSEEYLLALQSLDNFRLSLYGLENGGLFQKRSHMLEAEQKVNQGMSSLVMADCLGNRQRACTIANSIWGIGMWCMTSEEALGADRDGDGLAETQNGPDQEVEYEPESVQ